jgi:hypothetical protein
MVVNYITYNFLLLISIFLPSGTIINVRSICFLKSENKRFSWNLKLFLIVFVFIIVAGMRGENIGTDYKNYLEYYNFILDHGYAGSLFKRNELGWDSLNLWFGRLGVPAGIFFGLVAGSMWYFFIQGSYKFQFLLPGMLFFVITNGFFFWTLSGLRQSIAIMMFFYAIKYIIEKKPFHYALAIFIASLFHVSILIMLPAFLLWKIKFNQLIFCILFILSIFLMGSDSFLHVMDEVITITGSKFNFFMNYSSYLETDAFAANEERTSSGLGVILRILSTLFVLYKSKYVLKIQPNLTIYFILFLIGAICSNIFYSIEMIGRVLTYFNICFFIVIASAVYYSTNKYEIIISMLLVISYYIMFNFQIYKLDIFG